MSEHDRLEYWTATTAPITPENINGVINSPEWDSLPEDDKKFFLEVQKVVLDPTYMIPPPFYGLKTSQDKEILLPRGGGKLKLVDEPKSAKMGFTFLYVEPK